MGTHSLAMLGYGVILGENLPEELEIDSEKLEKFKNVCKQLKTQSSPQWILMSRYD